MVCRSDGASFWRARCYCSAQGRALGAGEAECDGTVCLAELAFLGFDEWYNICGAPALVELRRNHRLAEFLLLEKNSVAVSVGERSAGNGDVAVAM